MTKIGAMIDGYLDGGLRDEGLHALAAWIRADRANADHFARRVMIHRQTYDLLNDMDVQSLALDMDQAVDPSSESFARLLAQFALIEAQQDLPPVDISAMLEEQERQARRRRVPRRATRPGPAGGGTHHFVIPKALVYAAIAAMVVFAAAVLWPDAQHNQSAPDPAPVAKTPTPQPARPDRSIAVAELIGQHQAQWQGESPSVGSPLFTGQALTLTAGYAHLRFNNGAVVTLQAPATILPISARRLELEQGRLTAVCDTPASQGFTVITDTARVVDLSTVFGVERDELGRTTAGVIRGRIELHLDAQSAEAQPERLSAGRIIRIDSAGRAFADLDPAELQRYREWEHLLRHVRVDGQAQLIDHLTNALPEDEALAKVYRENTAVRLLEPLTVSQTQPGVYRPTLTNAIPLGAGEKVDSYLVHFDRPGKPIDKATRQFTIRFEQPVVALIFNREQLMDSDALFGVPGVSYPNTPRGIDNEAGMIDTVELSDDRKTLRVSFLVTDIDQIRVLTRSPRAASAGG